MDKIDIVPQRVTFIREGAFWQNSIDSNRRREGV
jgi:hypothetical protein